jgi:Fe-S-cluster containining protein
VVTDIAEIRRRAAEMRDDNREFARHLKAHHQSDEPFHILAAEVERHIDCTQCANCCRELSVSVSAGEIEEIARFLDMTPGEVARQCTSIESERVLATRDGACIFLYGNLCMIYEVRPRPCREFPHSDLHNQTLGGRMPSQLRRAEVCPIVFNTIEAYKRRLGWHRHLRKITTD